MKKTEMIDQEKGKKSRKLILILALLGIALVLLAIIGLIKFGTVFFFIPFWFWTVDKIIELTGANLWLARGFAALSVIPFFYLIKLIFSWKPEKRKVGWILLSALTASLCFIMFFLSEDIYFSFKTGQAQKWYIVTPEGKYEFSDSPGYNTLWGTQYQKVTPAVIKKYVEQEKAGKAIKTADNKEIVSAMPKENIPERIVEKAIPEKKITTQQTIPEKEIITKEMVPFIGGDWVVTWKSNSGQSGTSKITIKQKSNDSNFSGMGIDSPHKTNKAFRANGTVSGNNLTMFKKYEGSEVIIVYKGSILGDQANGTWTNSLNNSGTWSMSREKKIVSKKPTFKIASKKTISEETTPKKVASKRTTEKIIPGKKKVAEKPTFKIVPKETISGETTPKKEGEKKVLADPQATKINKNEYEGLLENKINRTVTVQIRKILPNQNNLFLPPLVRSLIFKGKGSIIISLPEGNYQLLWECRDSNSNRHNSFYYNNVTVNSHRTVSVIGGNNKVQEFYFVSSSDELLSW